MTTDDSLWLQDLLPLAPLAYYLGPPLEEWVFPHFVKDPYLMPWAQITAALWVREAPRAREPLTTILSPYLVEAPAPSALGTHKQAGLDILTLAKTWQFKVPTLLLAFDKACCKAVLCAADAAQVQACRILSWHEILSWQPLDPDSEAKLQDMISGWGLLQGHIIKVPPPPRLHTPFPPS